MYRWMDGCTDGCIKPDVSHQLKVLQQWPRSDATQVMIKASLAYDRGSPRRAATFAADGPRVGRATVTTPSPAPPEGLVARADYQDPTDSSTSASTHLQEVEQPVIGASLPVGTGGTTSFLFPEEGDDGSKAAAQGQGSTDTC